MSLDRRRYLEFEQPLAELDSQLSKLKDVRIQSNVDISSEIRRIEEKSAEMLKEIFAGLNSYQVVQLSRHPDRPNAKDYVNFVFDDFIELRGDRSFRDDQAIFGGLATFEGQSLMLIAHHKGKNTQENMQRNFGMPKPEGYRKALRLMKQAEAWKLPVVTFVDTPGAYPGLDAEERGQAEAIARNIFEMTGLRCPIISMIIGEGGSGGALAIAVADRVLMFEFATYSVISPEGCAAITWKDGSQASRAAEALKLGSKSVQELGVATGIIPEPLGGAHRDPRKAAESIRSKLSEELKSLRSMDIDELLEKRYDRYRKIGTWSAEAK